MSESNTPRTDAAYKVYIPAVDSHVCVYCEFAEQLESELIETKRKLSKAVELINELRGYCRDAWDWKYGKRWDAEMEEIK